jgi:hypothetical protein
VTNAEGSAPANTDGTSCAAPALARSNPIAAPNSAKGQGSRFLSVIEPPWRVNCDARKWRRLNSNAASGRALGRLSQEPQIDLWIEGGGKNPNQNASAKG